MLVNDKRIDFNARRSTLIDLGQVPAQARVEFNLTFKADSDGTGTFTLYSSALDREAFTTAIAALQSRSLAVDSFSDTHIKGHVTAQQDGLFIMTIPYDQGWQIKVDGQPVSSSAFADALLAFDLPAGSHQIDLRYTPPGFYPGLGVTLASLAILVILYRLMRRKRLKAVV